MKLFEHVEIRGDVKGGAHRMRALMGGLSWPARQLFGGSHRLLVRVDGKLYQHPAIAHRPRFLAWLAAPLMLPLAFLGALLYFCFKPLAKKVAPELYTQHADISDLTPAGDLPQTDEKAEKMAKVANLDAQAIECAIEASLSMQVSRVGDYTLRVSKGPMHFRLNQAGPFWYVSDVNTASEEPLPAVMAPGALLANGKPGENEWVGLTMLSLVNRLRREQAQEAQDDIPGAYIAPGRVVCKEHNGEEYLVRTGIPFTVLKMGTSATGQLQAEVLHGADALLGKTFLADDRSSFASNLARAGWLESAAEGASKGPAKVVRLQVRLSQKPQKVDDHRPEEQLPRTEASQRTLTSIKAEGPSQLVVDTGDAAQEASKMRFKKVGSLWMLREGETDQVPLNAVIAGVNSASPQVAQYASMSAADMCKALEGKASNLCYLPSDKAYGFKVADVPSCWDPKDQKFYQYRRRRWLRFDAKGDALKWEPTTLNFSGGGMDTLKADEIAFAHALNANQISGTELSVEPSRPQSSGKESGEHLKIDFALTEKIQLVTGKNGTYLWKTDKDGAPLNGVDRILEIGGRGIGDFRHDAISKRLRKATPENPVELTILRDPLMVPHVSGQGQRKDITLLRLDTSLPSGPALKVVRSDNLKGESLFVKELRLPTGEVLTDPEAMMKNAHKAEVSLTVVTLGELMGAKGLMLHYDSARCDDRLVRRPSSARGRGMPEQGSKKRKLSL